MRPVDELKLGGLFLAFLACTKLLCCFLLLGALLLAFLLFLALLRLFHGWIFQVALHQAAIFDCNVYSLLFLALCQDLLQAGTKHLFEFVVVLFHECWYVHRLHEIVEAEVFVS